MLQSVAIAAGGACGALARFWISTGVYGLLGREFPWGTLVVNLLGSLLMGALFVLFVERLALAPEWRAAVLVGFLGALTTFSTFSFETLALIEQGELLRAALNAGLSVALCLVLCWAGMALGRAWW